MQPTGKTALKRECCGSENISFFVQRPSLSLTKAVIINDLSPGFRVPSVPFTNIFSGDPGRSACVVRLSGEGEKLGTVCGAHTHLRMYRSSFCFGGTGVITPFLCASLNFQYHSVGTPPPGSIHTEQQAGASSTRAESRSPSSGRLQLIRSPAGCP